MNTAWVRRVSWSKVICSICRYCILNEHTKTQLSCRNIYMVKNCEKFVWRWGAEIQIIVVLISKWILGSLKMNEIFDNTWINIDYRMPSERKKTNEKYILFLLLLPTTSSEICSEFKYYKLIRFTILKYKMKRWKYQKFKLFNFL